MNLAALVVRRPVAAVVLGLLVAALGLGAMFRLPVREYPAIDPPIVSVSVTYPGASAEVVERDVTRIIEDALSGIEAIGQIRSTSRAGLSQVSVEFGLDRNLDAAAADVRDNVSAVVNRLPDGVDPPVITKASADARAMMWISLTSDVLDQRALTDIAIRTLVDPLSVVPGVAQVQIGGERRYAARIWLDPVRMAARGVTVTDVVDTLRTQNIELPAGRIETGPRELSIRALTRVAGPEEFSHLVVRAGEGYQVTLADVARIEVGAQEDRSALFRGGLPAVGLGIVRQSGANTLTVADGVRAELERLRPLLPPEVTPAIAYDESLFIRGSIDEVVKTLGITALLVVAVIYLFLGSKRATLIPAATIPVSLVATFAVLYALGYSINTLTLLSLVLAVGLVVDDAIVVLENITRHAEERREPPLRAAVVGASEVGLAVVATTAVLVAVLLPIAAVAGNIGRLFAEFATTLAAAVIFSSFLALTLGTAIASGVLRPRRPGDRNPLLLFSRGVDWVGRGYGRLVRPLVARPWIVALVALLLGSTSWWFFQNLPRELAPTEDRGVIIVPVTAPEGASLAETQKVVAEVEAVLAPYRGPNGPIVDVLSIVGAGRAGPPRVTNAFVIARLADWAERDVTQMALVRELTPRIMAIPGGRAIAINPPSLAGTGFGKPIQFVVAGPDYPTAFGWAQEVLERARRLGTMVALELEYNEESPQVGLTVDRRLAAQLGVPLDRIGQTLQVFFAGQEVTEYQERGETYRVVVQGEPGARAAIGDIGRLMVRSTGGELVPLAGIVATQETGTAREYRRIDRMPSMVISAVPAPGTDIATALAQLRDLTVEVSGGRAAVNYLDLSREFVRASGAQAAVFGLAMVIVLLVLAALFESFAYPFVVFLGVPLAVAGALGALWGVGGSFNTFTQIGLLLVIGLFAKNAILIIDFANERRREGMAVAPAAIEAARTRFRPILMTSVATIAGVVPLMLATGPGAEARSVLGITVAAGVLGGTLVTLFMVPGFYALLAGLARTPGDRDRRLAEEERRAAPARRRRRVQAGRAAPAAERPSRKREPR
ncbi:MAG TPA: efflux RND transporter permease subunit [Beijerinckiaceae bacterium]|nr:efflux RND transporter permease subunit [Beijerinckiaceae bacterium]